MENKKVAIIGAGAFGTALAQITAKNGHQVKLWSFDKKAAEQINKEHINGLFLPDVTLHEKILATTDLNEAVDEADFLILATPSLFTINVAKQILNAPEIREGKCIIATIAKGFIDTEKGPGFIVQSLEDYLPGRYKGNVVYISGPSHAEEVARRKLTGLISACQNPKNSILFRELLSGDRVKVFSSLDIVGVQTCAALKNVVAIAFGMLDAMKDQESQWVGDNTESLLFAAGLNEIQILGMAMGATHAETFSSIAGVGDLDVTCRSIYGRNRRFGRDIVLKGIIDKYKNLQDLLDHIQEIPYLPEGVFAAGYAKQLKEKYNLKLPLIQSVYDILNKDKKPQEAVSQLFL
ncbi:MAG: NAD(P)-dependent glycerol-3-phosphate dehydrogenase [Spirochaetaceae bacterium]|jgi:glycerol-3-phosphate dehydrogenase (NAD(P)+)|nr:NAD(P)-dependent glycerol-3-phosphate dehydrogenase [Spirochaetaceae bacterium]